MSSALLREVAAIRQLLVERLPAGPPPAPLGLADFLLGPEELRIVRTVASGEPLTLKAIARRTHNVGIGGRTKTQLRFVLAGLVRRLILVGERDGYRVNPAFRQLVSALLEEK